LAIDNVIDQILRYISTRGDAPALGFEDVLLTGLARDGGLYLPETWPVFSASDIDALSGLSYTDLALRVMTPFVGDEIPETEFAKLIEEAYASFDHQAVAPLRQLDHNEWLMELFHGPTLAFKDFALQLLGRLLDRTLTNRGSRATIVGATSGDTGSAAIEACRDRDAIDIFILHPKGRVSEVQRRQMTTVMSDNVHNIAIEGTFDDCQAMVKAMFNNLEFRDEIRLSAVNSINWARVMAQIVYYFHAAVALGAPHREVTFSVPTGNFGDVFAGYCARQMGLPINQLIVATNRNDILARFFQTGSYSKGTVHPTMSPSMDIQVSSNFERLLFDMEDRDGDRIRALMAALDQSGEFDVDAERLAESQKIFTGLAVDEEQTLDVIRDVATGTGTAIDPHSAIGVAAGRKVRRDPTTPLVTLATAHPAKFPDAVEKATGERPELPSRLADLLQRQERYEVLPNDLAAVMKKVRASARG
jgi:threonine synthase